MRIHYYAGCTLKTTAKNFEQSALAVMHALGIETVELPRWYCCGTVYSLATDDLMRHLGAVRNLIRVQEAGGSRMVTLCSMCYNTLKRANLFVTENQEALDKINNFMDLEEDYRGGVEVKHLLQVLKDDIGFDTIAKKTSCTLERLKVIPYYGCLLLRPQEVGIDDPESPSILTQLFSALGAEVLEDPFSTECCGSYQVVTNTELVLERAYTILSSAATRGGDAVAVSCPLCHFNLDKHQQLAAQKYPYFKKIPVFYFTQLLAIALELPPDTYGLELHAVDARKLLKQKNLIA